MKTTIQIPDSHYKEMRRLAQREQRTKKAIVEESLRRTLSERQRRAQKRPIGLAKGEFAIPKEFFEPLPEELVQAFQGEGK